LTRRHTAPAPGASLEGPPGANFFGETPFGGRFAHPESFWCYAHQTAPKVGDFWTSLLLSRFRVVGYFEFGFPFWV
jgi:hypothetical protein